jgi:hypothetical protein
MNVNSQHNRNGYYKLPTQFSKFCYMTLHGECMESHRASFIKRNNKKLADYGLLDLQV